METLSLLVLLINRKAIKYEAAVMMNMDLNPMMSTNAPMKSGPDIAASDDAK